MRLSAENVKNKINKSHKGYYNVTKENKMVPSKLKLYLL